MTTEVQVARKALRVAESTRRAAKDAKTGVEAEMEDARKEYWEVQKLKQHAEEMEKKVMLEKQQMRAANAYRKGLEANLVRLTKLVKDSANSKLDSDQLLTETQKQDHTFEREVEDAREVVKSATKSWREQQLAAESASSRENSELAQMEQIVHGVKQHQRKRLAEDKESLRVNLKEAKRAATVAKAQLRTAQETADTAREKKHAAQAALVEAEHSKRKTEQAADAQAQRERYEVNSRAEKDIADMKRDAADQVRDTIAELNAQVNSATTDKTEAEHRIKVANEQIAEGVRIRDQTIEAAKSQAGRDVAEAQARAKEAKQRDEREVQAFLEKAERLRSTLGSMTNPQEKAAAEAKLQAYAEAAQQLAGSDGMDVKKHEQDLELKKQQIAEDLDSFVERANSIEKRNKAQAEREITDAKMGLTNANKRITDLKAKQEKAKTDIADRLKSNIETVKMQLKRYLDQIQKHQNAKKGDLSAMVAEAKQVASVTVEREKEADITLEKAQTEFNHRDEALQAQRHQNIELLEKAHAAMLKVNDEAKADLRIKKAKLREEVQLARQASLQAHDSLPRIKQAVEDAKMRKMAAEEAVKQAKDELSFHIRTETSAADQIETTKADISDVKSRIDVLEKQLLESSKQADEAQAKASGDFTAVELRHEHAQKAFDQAMAQYTKAVSGVERAQAVLEAKQGLEEEAKHAAAYAEEGVASAKSMQKEANSAAEAKSEEGAKSLEEAQGDQDKAQQLETQASQGQSDAKANYEAVGHALSRLQESADAAMQEKQKEVQAEVDAAEDKATAAVEADKHAVRAASEAVVSAESSEGLLTQSRKAAAEAKKTGQVQKDASQTDLGMKEQAATQAENELLKVQKVAEEVRSVFRKKVDERDSEYQIDAKRTAQAKRSMQDANKELLIAEHTSKQADMAVNQAQEHALASKNALRAAQEEAQDAKSKLKEAHEKEQQDKRSAVAKDITESRLRARVTEHKRDEAVNKAEEAEEALPGKIAEFRMHARERSEKLQSRHTDSMKTVESRARQATALAQKKVEIAAAAQVQAELAVEHAQQNADYAQKKADSQIEAVKTSTQNAIDLAQRRTESARKKMAYAQKQAADENDKAIELQTKSSAALESQRLAEGDASAAKTQLEAAQDEHSLTVRQKDSLVQNAVKARDNAQVALGEANKAHADQQADLKKVEEELARVKLQETEMELKKKDKLLQSEFAVSVARSKSNEATKSAQDKANAEKEKAQLELDAEEEKYAIKLSTIRSQQSSRAGKATEGAAVTIKTEQDAAVIEIQAEEARRENALTRLSHAQTNLQEAREERIEFVSKKQQYELRAKEHHKDMLLVRKQMKVDETRIKSEEREADTKHKEKVRRMELDQKAIEKARADERAAKELWAKSTSAPTAAPTKAPTETPTPAPTNPPTSAPTVPLPCTNTTDITSDLISRDINATQLIIPDDDDNENDSWPSTNASNLNTTNTTNTTKATRATNGTSLNATAGAGTQHPESEADQGQHAENDSTESSDSEDQDHLPEIAPEDTGSEQIGFDLNSSNATNTTLNTTSTVSNATNSTMNTTSSNATDMVRDLDLVLNNATNETQTATQSPMSSSDSDSFATSAQYLERVHSMYASTQELGADYGVNGADQTANIPMDSDDSIDVTGVDDIGDDYRNDVANSVDDDGILYSIIN